MPTGRYLEMEAANAWGYKLWEWQAETIVNKARAMAHYLHRTIREAYIEEKMATKAPKGRPETQSLSGLMAGMGIRPR